MAKAKPASPIYAQLQAWFVKFIWPWVVEKIWPELEKQVIASFMKAVSALKSSVVGWSANLKGSHQVAAQKKAAQAEQMAKASQSAAEAEKYEAVARVWREVAEQYRQENELLKLQLDEAAKGAASDFRSELDSMGVEDIIEVGENNSLTLKGSGTVLQLPEPTNKPQARR